MADDFDPDKFLASRGVDLKKPKPPAEPPTATPPPATSFGPKPASADTGNKPSTFGPQMPKTFDKDEYRRKLYNDDWTIRATVGASKALASIPIGLSRLAGTMLPSLGEWAAKTRKAHPAADSAIRTMEEFAGSPSNSKMESVGYGAGLLGSSLLAPELGGAKVATMASRYLPAFSRWTRPIMAAGKAVDAAGQGAIGGAIGNPDDPKTGAIGGAVLGPAVRGLGALASGPAGRYWGAHALPAIVAYPAYHALKAAGIPNEAAYSIIPLLTWYHSPGGRPLRLAGSTLIDWSGRVVAAIPPAAMGYLGGKDAGEAAQAVGEMGGDVASGIKEAVQ
jgi:hypothetical protein